MAYEIFREGRPVKGVLFDMDGLVLDSEILYTRFWREAVEELGWPMSWEQALGMRSLNHDRGQAYLSSLFGPGIDYKQARAIRIRRMDAWIDEHGVAPKPGVRALLSDIHRRGLPCAITTSSPPERVRDHLSPLGLYDQFDAICTVHQVARGKPEPDIYLFGAETLGLRAEDCLALEDSPAGIESASRAGCMAVVVPDQDQPGETILAKCFARADSLGDVCGILKALNG